MPLGEGDWTHQPFAGETDGDKLFGRGSSDMKSGVAAMVLMALRLTEAKNLKAGITLVLTAGEETTCEGAACIAALDGALEKVGAIIAGEPSGCLFTSAEEKPTEKGIMIYLNANGRLDDAIAAVTPNGGKIVQPKQPIGPFGFRAIIIDSEGNRVALHSD